MPSHCFLRFPSALRTSALTAVSFAALSVASNAQDVTELSTIVVDGEADTIRTDGFVPETTRSATKTATPVSETTRSVSVISQKQLEILKPQNLSEAVSYTPGVRVGQYGAEPRFDAFKIRGIDLTYTGIFRDGLRQISSPNGLMRLEPYSVEAIAALRGPAASIYGASSSGGIIDIISKRPTAETLREVELTYGSHQRRQAAFDFSGSANADNTLLYRLTGLARRSGTEIDAVPDDRLFIAPALTWLPTDNTTITVLGEYMDSLTGGTWGWTNNLGPDGSSTGAENHYSGDKHFNDFRQKQWRLGYEIEHNFNEDLTLHHRLRYSDLSMKQEWVADGWPGLGYEDNSGLASDTYLESRFDTGSAQHTLIAGVDYSYMHYDATQYQGGALSASYDYTPDPAYDKTMEQTQNTFGLYIQDQVEIQNWRLSAGLRHDWHNSTFDQTYQDADTHLSRNDSETTGQASIGYVFGNGIMPYVSYGTSYVANPGVALNTGDQAAPTLGRQVELGVKYQIPGHNILLSAAVFNIDQENATVYETSSGVNDQIQLDMRSRGVELEAAAKFDNGLSFIGSYSYNDVKIKKLTDATVGNQLNSTPYHMVSLLADYEFASGPFQGLGLSAGVRYVGSSFGDNVHTAALINKPRTFVDASLRYDLGKLNPSLDGVKWQLNATNLLNEVKQVCTTGWCYFDEGRKVTTSLRFRF